MPSGHCSRRQPAPAVRHEPRLRFRLGGCFRSEGSLQHGSCTDSSEAMGNDSRSDPIRGREADRPPQSVRKGSTRSGTAGPDGGVVLGIPFEKRRASRLSLLRRHLLEPHTRSALWTPRERSRWTSATPPPMSSIGPASRIGSTSSSLNVVRCSTRRARRSVVEDRPGAARRDRTGTRRLLPSASTRARRPRCRSVHPRAAGLRVSSSAEVEAVKPPAALTDTSRVSWDQASARQHHP